MRSVMNVPNEGNCSVFWIKTLYKPGRGPRSLVTLAWAILQSAGKTVFRDLYRRPGRRSFHTKHHASPLHSGRISAFSQPNSSDTTPSPPRRPPWRLSAQEHCRSPARYSGQQENMADNFKRTSCHLCLGEGHLIQLHKWLRVRKFLQFLHGCKIHVRALGYVTWRLQNTRKGIRLRNRAPLQSIPQGKEKDSSFDGEY